MHTGLLGSICATLRSFVSIFVAGNIISLLMCLATRDKEDFGDLKSADPFEECAVKGS